MKPPPPVRQAAQAWWAAWSAGDQAAVERLAAQLEALGWLVTTTGSGYSLVPRPPETDDGSLTSSA